MRSRTDTVLTGLVCGAIALLAGARAASADALVVHACASCETDTGGAGIALETAAKRQWDAGYDVAIVTLDDARKKSIDLATAFDGAGVQSQVVDSAGHHYKLKIFTNQSTQKKLSVYWITDRELADQDDVFDDLVARARQANEPIRAFEMHLVGKMTLEKQLAWRFHRWCQTPSSETTRRCDRVPVIAWPGSDAGDLEEAIGVSDAVFTVSAASQRSILDADAGFASPGGPALCDPKTCQDTDDKYAIPIFDGVVYPLQEGDARAFKADRRLELRKHLLGAQASDGFEALARTNTVTYRGNDRVEHTASDNAATLADVPPDAPIVLFFGRIDATGNPRALVEHWSNVLAAVPAAHLVIAGAVDEGPDSFLYFEELMHLVDDFNGKNGPSIHVVARRVSSQHLYAFADVYASPSLAETTGTTVLEAMAQGTPVVASNLPAYGDVVRDAVNGYLADASSDAFYLRIADLLEDKEGQVEKLRDAGFRTTTSFSAQAIGARARAAIDAVYARVNGGAIDLGGIESIPDWAEVEAK